MTLASLVLAALAVLPSDRMAMADRLFDRVIDNSKVLAATGLAQSDLMPTAKGLETELAKVPRDYEWRGYEGASARMDDWLAAH